MQIKKMEEFIHQLAFKMSQHKDQLEDSQYKLVRIQQQVHLKVNQNNISLNMNDFHFTGIIQIQHRIKQIKQLQQNNFLLIYKNGNQYIGELQNMYPHGKGTLISKNYTYTGDFQYGKFDGMGNIVYTCGDVYRGEFYQGKRNGNGQYIFQNGTYFNGLSVNNKISSGTIFTKNGITMRGQFQNDKIIEGVIEDDTIKCIGTYNDSGMIRGTIFIKYTNQKFDVEKLSDIAFDNVFLYQYDDLKIIYCRLTGSVQLLRSGQMIQDYFVDNIVEYNEYYNNSATGESSQQSVCSDSQNSFDRNYLQKYGSQQNLYLSQTSSYFGDQSQIYSDNKPFQVQQQVQLQSDLHKNINKNFDLDDDYIQNSQEYQNSSKIEFSMQDDEMQ